MLFTVVSATLRVSGVRTRSTKPGLGEVIGCPADCHTYLSVNRFVAHS